MEMGDRRLGTSERKTHRELNGSPEAAQQTSYTLKTNKTQPVGEKLKDHEIKRTH